MYLLSVSYPLIFIHSRNLGWYTIYSSNESPVSSVKSTCTFVSLGLTFLLLLYTGMNTGSIPEVVCVMRLVVPVGAIVRHAIFLRPNFVISSYSAGSTSFILLMKGFFFSLSASYTSNAPLSFAICTEERYASTAIVLCTSVEKYVASGVP